MKWNPRRKVTFAFLAGGCADRLREVLMLAVTLILCFPIQGSASSFTVNKNGTVTDSRTGLVWQGGDSFIELKKGLNWYEALEYVEKKNLKNFAGHKDWRLPTLDELEALWDSTRPSRSKDGEAIGLPEGFTDGGSYYLWTIDEKGLDNAWYFGLGQKEKYFNLKDLADLEQGIRMVRKQQ